MKPILIILSLFISLIAKADFTGRIFTDTNGNGKWDKGERTFPDILVTNGKEVVKSATDGTFTLPFYEKARFIRITTPSGYHSKFFYLEVRQNKNDYNFDLRINPKAKDNKVSFIHITDTESYNSGLWVDNLRDYAKNNQSDFIIHSGDICYDQGLRFHRDSINTHTMGVPTYYAIGNHDLLNGKYGEEVFEQSFGPCWYSFEAGGVHFIVSPMPGGDHQPSYTTDEVLTWITNDLNMIKEKQPVVIINHTILVNYEDLILKSDNLSLDLSKYNFMAWIYGHWHINYLLNHPKGPWLITTSPPDKGGIDHSPSTFRVITIDSKNNKLETENRYTYLNRHLSIVYPNSNELVNISGGKVEISVNAYHTPSQIKKMSYSITSALEKDKWQEMKQASDWNWGTTYKFTDKQIKAETSGLNPMRIKVRAETYSGEIIEKEESFNYLNRDIVAPKMIENWVNLRGNPAHDSLPSYQTAPRLTSAWIKNVGANIFMTSPVLAEGKVFIATIDDAALSKCAIFALDAETGETLWKYPTRNSIKNTIVYAKDKIFATDASGYLYAINAKTGKLLSEKKLNVNLLPAVVEGMLTDGERVYTGTGKGFCAIDATSLNEIWCNTAWGQGEGTVSTMTLGDGVILTGAHWQALYAHDATTGKLLWKLSDSNLRFRDGTATFKNGKFYLASGNKLYVLNARTGEQEHVRLSEYNFFAASSPLLFENIWITGSSDKGLLAFDLENLKPMWHCPTKPSLFYTVPYSKSRECSVETSPIISGRYVYFGGSDGIFYVVNPESGKVEQQFDFGAPIFSSVALAGRMLYICDFSGNVHAFYMQDWV